MARRPAVTDALLALALGVDMQVELFFVDDALELSVADLGDGGPSPQLTGAGHGLMGMRERLRVYGGDVESGRRPAGGFEVAARLPLERALAG